MRFLGGVVLAILLLGQVVFAQLYGHNSMQQKVIDDFEIVVNDERSMVHEELQKINKLKSPLSASPAYVFPIKKVDFRVYPEAGSSFVEQNCKGTDSQKTCENVVTESYLIHIPYVIATGKSFFYEGLFFREIIERRTVQQRNAQGFPFGKPEISWTIFPIEKLELKTR